MQAVEHVLRSERGLRGVSDVVLAGVDDSVVRFRTVDGPAYAARVSEADGPSVPASCGEPPKPQQSFAVGPV